MAKHTTLHSIAHNWADSLACGLGFALGDLYMSDIFAEAELSEAKYISVDFLTGKIAGGEASESLQNVIRLYCERFPHFCEKHSAKRDEYREFTAVFSAGALGCEPRLEIIVADAKGKRSSIQYHGRLGRRVRVMDKDGKIIRAKRKTV